MTDVEANSDAPGEGKTDRAAFTEVIHVCVGKPSWN